MVVLTPAFLKAAPVVSLALLCGHNGDFCKFQVLLICAAGDIALVWEGGFVVGTLLFCVAFARLLAGVGFSPRRAELLLAPGTAVLGAAVLLKFFEPVKNDEHSTYLLFLRYTYMLLLTLLGWRLLVADVLGSNRRTSSGFFVGILINAFLYKAEVLAPRENYAARMAVYYAGCVCLAVSPTITAVRAEKKDRSD